MSGIDINAGSAQMASPQTAELKALVELLDPRITKKSVGSIVDALNSCYALKGHLITQLNAKAIPLEQFSSLSQHEQLGLYNKSKKALDNTLVTTAINNLELVLGVLEQVFAEQESPTPPQP